MADAPERRDEPSDPDSRVELELVTRLIVAASDSDSALEDEQIDRLLDIAT